MYCDVLDLKIGDIFVEDCYPEIYEVVELIPHGIVAIDLDTGEEVEFSCTIPAYAPVIYLID